MNLEDIYRNFIVAYRNAFDMFDAVSQALYTEQQNVTVDITDPTTNEIVTVNIPSIRKLSKDIDRLTKNYQSLISLDGNNGQILTPDGQRRKVFISTLEKEPDPIESIVAPTNFKTRNNWFFDGLLNPLLYVEFDYSNQIDDSVTRFEVTKYILSLDTEKKQEFFDDNYRNNSNISYDKFISDIATEGIGVIVDREELPIATKENIVYGNFDVLRIYDDSQIVDVDGVEQTITRKKYQLSTLTYNSKLTTLLSTERLKVGDNLLLTSDDSDTRFAITEIDTAENTVVLERMEGFGTIIVGSNILRLYSNTFTNTTVQVSVGLNNYTVLFLRPISNSNIVSDFYSIGCGYYTNDLVIQIDNEDVTLAEYYQNQVTDFGQLLIGLAKDSNSSTVFAELPDAPTLSTDDFKVVVINQHLTNQTNVKKLQQLQTQKTSLSSELSNLNESIDTLTKKVNTTNYSTTQELNLDRKKLSSLNISRDNKKKTFNSLVRQINSEGTTANSKIKAKHRIRGFFPIPNAKTNIRTGTQEIVQFTISYRYLSKSGDVNPAEKISFKDIDGKTVNGSQPEWVEVNSKIRSRVFNDETQQFEWVVEDFENSEVNNINQVDIPIQQGESVEIRVKSISSAGFPSNPLESSWSDSITIEFPDDLIEDTTIDDIVEQSSREIVRVELDEELQSTGVIAHVNDKVESNTKTYFHDSENIYSGFKDDDDNLQSVFQKFIAMESEINILKTKLEGNVENFDIILKDSSGTEIEINKDQSNEIFVGYYKDIVSNETIKQGTIVTRQYKLCFRNNSNSDLILQSLNRGNSSSNADVTVIDGVDYDYANVPIVRRNSITQYPQKKGQFIYNRKVNLFDQSLYDGNQTNSLFNFAISQTDCVIQNSDFSSPLVLDPTALYIHEDHPQVDQLGTYVGDNIVLPNNLPNSNLQNEFVLDDRQLFDVNDKFLIGQNSTGAFVSILSDDDSLTNLRVEGETILSKRTVSPNDLVEIPIIFQFRLTDYYGDTSSGGGIGRIGGVDNADNITITKTLGFDFTTLFGGQSGFDLKFTCKYTNDTVNV